ncbi:7576_t:CDS:2, partial [Funneliformis caledonium]
EVWFDEDMFFNETNPIKVNTVSLANDVYFEESEEERNEKVLLLQRLQPVKTNNSLEEVESQATNTMESKRKRVPCCMNAKNKTRENEELSLIDDDTTESKRKRVLCHMNAKKKIKENDDDDGICTILLIHSPESFYDQRLPTYNIAPSSSIKDHSLENTYDQQSSVSNMTNITSSLTESYSFESTNNQLSIASNITNITTSSLIGPFKNNLEVCLYLVQHPELINLTMNMMKAGGQESITTREKVDKFNVLPEKKLGMLQMHLKCLFFRTRVINKQIIDTLIRSLFPNIQNTRASDRAALQT